MDCSKKIWKSRTEVCRHMEIWKSRLGKNDLAGQKRTSSQSSKPHRRRRRRQPMMQQIPEQYQKYMNTRTRMKKRTTTMVRTKNHPTSQTTRIMPWKKRRFRSPAHLRRRAEERSAQKDKNVFVKRPLMTKPPKRPITLVPPPEDPVKRRLMKKTHLRNDELVMNVDEDLFNVVNTLMKDETSKRRILTKTMRCRS